MPVEISAAIAASFGLPIGSFLNAAAYRIPRDLSLVHRSRCPACDTTIRPYDLIPVLSWLALRGKCRNCRSAISVRYFVVEVITAALWGAIGWRWGWNLESVTVGVGVTFLVLLSLIDFDTKRLPTPVVWLGVVSTAVPFTAIAITDQNYAALRDMGLGVAIVAGVLGALWVVWPGGIGFGDVRLGVLIGALTGWFGPGVAVTVLVFASGAQSLVGVGILMRGGSLKARMAFGPFLAGGTIAALFFGRAAFDWYLRTFT